MCASPQPDLPHEISQDERTMAVLAHALQVMCTWIAPLVIFLVRPNSRFVRFHALQAVILQVLLGMFWIIGVAVFMAVMITTMPHSGTTGQNAPPPAFMFVFPVFWLIAMSVWVVMVVFVIVYALKAGRGEWAGYPLIGNLARRFLNM